MLKRVAAVGLSAGLSAGLLTLTTPLVVSADSNCPTASGGLSGDGLSSATAYLIEDASDLQEFRDDSQYWGTSGSLRYTRITSNIDMGGCTWSTVIGSGSPAFFGDVDGGGFVISGLNIQGTSLSYAGLFGITGTGTHIYDLTFTGNVTNTTSNTNHRTGGLIGGVFNDTQLTNVHATGSVSGGSSGGVGGLVGYAAGNGLGSSVIIARSSASGDVTGTGAYVGGLIGLLQEVSLSNSFASGGVQGSTQVGGLVGYYGGQGTIATSYSVGAVTATSNGGGLVGGPLSVSATDSYWNTETAVPTTTSKGGTGKTTAEMKDISTYSSWSIASGYDASSTWGICSAVNDGYPFLTGAYSSDPCSSGGLGAGSSLETIYALTLEPSEGTRCSVGSVSGLKNTWVDLPAADVCTPPETAPESVLLGWATKPDFPVEIAQRQVTGGMGAYELTDEFGTFTNIFIPSGGSAFIVAPNRLYAVWSESVASAR